MDAAEIARQLDAYSGQERLRPVKIKDSRKGDWRFANVDAAINQLRGELPEESPDVKVVETIGEPHAPGPSPGDESAPLYKVLNSVSAATPGLAYRTSMDLAARHPTAAASWDTRVTGVEIEGWLKVRESRYLPMEVDGKKVLVLVSGVPHVAEQSTSSQDTSAVPPAISVSESVMEELAPAPVPVANVAPAVSGAPAAPDGSGDVTRMDQAPTNLMGQADLAPVMGRTRRDMVSGECSSVRELGRQASRVAPLVPGRPQCQNPDCPKPTWDGEPGFCSIACSRFGAESL